MKPTQPTTAPPVSPTTTTGTPFGRPRAPAGSSEPKHQPILQPFLPPQRIPMQVIGSRKSSGSGAPRVRTIPPGGFKGPGAPKMALPVTPNVMNTAKYKAAEKNVRFAIIAMPVAIVTSYYLYQRLVKGEERKILSHDLSELRSI